MQINIKTSAANQIVVSNLIRSLFYLLTIASFMSLLFVKRMESTKIMS